MQRRQARQAGRLQVAPSACSALLCSAPPPLPALLSLSLSLSLFLPPSCKARIPGPLAPFGEGARPSGVADGCVAGAGPMGGGEPEGGRERARRSLRL